MNEYYYPLVSEPNTYTYNNPFPTETAVLNLGETTGVASGYLGQTLYNDWNVMTARGKSVSGGNCFSSFDCQSYIIGQICFLDIKFIPSNDLLRNGSGSETNLMRDLPPTINNFIDVREYGKNYPLHITTTIQASYLSINLVSIKTSSTATWTEGEIHYMIMYLHHPEVHRIYTEVYGTTNNADLHLNRFSFMTLYEKIDDKQSEPIYDTASEAMEAGKNDLINSSYPIEPYSQPSNGEKIKYIYKVFIGYDSTSAKWYYQFAREVHLLGKGTLLAVSPSSTIT